MIFYIIYRRCKWYLLQMYAVFHSQAKIVDIYLIKWFTPVCNLKSDTFGYYNTLLT